MNQKLKAKLLLGTFLISGLLLPTKNASLVFANGTPPASPTTAPTSSSPAEKEDEKTASAAPSQKSEEKSSVSPNTSSTQHKKGSKVDTTKPKSKKCLKTTLSSKITPIETPIPPTEPRITYDADTKKLINIIAHTILSSKSCILSNKALFEIETFIQTGLYREVKFKFAELDTPVTFIEAAIMKNKWRVLRTILNYPHAYNLSTNPTLVQHLFELAKSTPHSHKTLEILQKGVEAKFLSPIY